MGEVIFEKRGTVCHITQSFYNPLYSLQFDKMLSRGWNVLAFNFLNKENQSKMIERDYLFAVKPYRNLDRFFFFWKEKKVLKELEKVVSGKNIDLFHAHTLFSSGYLAYHMHKKIGVDYVVSVRNTDINHFFKTRFYLRPMGVRILKNAKKIVFISESARKTLVDKYLDRKTAEEVLKKSTVCTNGVSDFWLQNKALNTEIEENAVRIIYCGDINQNKNLLHTVEACDILQSRGIRVKYTVIGRILDENLWHKISRDYIEYHGFMKKEELIGYLCKNDIFVMPSYSETFGLSYLEAMSQGLPVIYTRGQGFDGLFADGEIGFGVDPSDANEIADKIQAVMKDYTRLSTNAFSRVDRFDWDNIVNQLIELYSEILEAKK